MSSWAQQNLCPSLKFFAASISLQFWPAFMFLQKKRTPTAWYCHSSILPWGWGVQGCISVSYCHTMFQFHLSNRTLPLWSEWLLVILSLNLYSSSRVTVSQLALCLNNALISHSDSWRFKQTQRLCRFAVDTNVFHFQIFNRTVLHETFKAWEFIT